MGQCMSHHLQMTELAHDLVQNSHKCIFLPTLGENICMNKSKPNPTAKKQFSACALPLKIFFSSKNVFTNTEREEEDGKGYVCLLHSQSAGEVKMRGIILGEPLGSSPEVQPKVYRILECRDPLDISLSRCPIYKQKSSPKKITIIFLGYIMN